MDCVNVEIKFHTPRYVVWLVKALIVVASATLVLRMTGVKAPVLNSPEPRIVAVDCSKTFSENYQTTPAIGLQQYDEIVPGKEGLFDGTCRFDLTVPDRICSLISLCIDGDYFRGFRNPYPWENRVIKRKRLH